MKKKKRSKNTKKPQKVFLKIIRDNDMALYQNFKWPLPTKSKKGEWTPFIRYIIPCRRGYHLCQDLNSFLVWWRFSKGKELKIFAAQAQIKEMKTGKNKIVTKTSRLLYELKIPQTPYNLQCLPDSDSEKKFKKSIRRQLKRRNMVLYGEASK